MCYLEIELNKISRNTGEDEFDLIHSLKEKRDICITFEEIFPRVNNKVGIFILEPFSDKKYKEIKEFYKSNYIPNLFKKYVKTITKNDRIYLRHPILVNISRINDEIIEDLKEEHGIVNSKFSEIQWEQIQNTESWRITEIQVAREIIATNLLSEFNEIE